MVWSVNELHKIEEKLDKLERDGKRAEKLELIETLESMGYVAIAYDVYGRTCYTIESEVYAKAHKHI